MATSGTAAYFESSGLNTIFVKKVSEGRPHVVDHITNGEVQLVINTTFGEKEVAQSYSIRRASIIHRVPYFTTVAASRAAVGGIEVMVKEGLDVKAIQDYY